MNSIPSNSTSHSIGNILVATGRLSVEDAANIIQRQQKDNIKFGDAAIAMKLLSKDDIDFALSKQFDYSYLADKDTSISAEIIAAYKPFSMVGENLRALRSQLMLRWFNNDKARKILAIVSPNSGDGRSFIAANLAIVFAQQGERTLLIDGDMRFGRQQRLFKLGNSSGLSGLLSARAGLDTVIQVSALPGLFVMPAGAAPPNPQELLGRPAFERLLQVAAEQFDVIIIDTPAGDKFADAEIISARAGAALLVTRKNRTTLNPATKLVQRLQNSGVALVGAVLNDD